MNEDLNKAYLDMDRQAAVDVVEKALADGNSAKDIMEANRMAMEAVGKNFETGEFFLSELILSAEICKAVSAILEPILAKNQAEKDPRKVIVFGTPQGDIHDLGKNLTAIILKAQGFEVIDLGVDVPPQKFIDAVKEHNATILAMSALITPTFKSIKKIVTQLEEEGLREKIFVIIGGAVTNDLARDEMGADAQTKDPMEAVQMCEKFIQGIG
jgi:methylmalonyl-CoA mutase cobalamin-binding domain/chain